MKPQLLINKADIRNRFRTLGMTEMLNYLIDSDLFEIGEHTEELKGSKKERGALMFFNGKKILVDWWEYPLPAICERRFNENFDLIIKLQHPNEPMDFFLKKCKRKNTLKNLSEEQQTSFFNKFVPWTFFPSRLMKPYIDNLDELPQISEDIPGFFCGKFWKCRHHLIKQLREQDVECTQSVLGIKNGKRLTDAQYLQEMARSKFGIVLHGRVSHFTEGKNRREIDYMMFKKPLLLDYKPNYYNPLIEGTHYILLKHKKTEIDQLESQYDIKQIAENGHKWYLENASPLGTAKTFLQIMKERLG